MSMDNIVVVTRSIKCMVQIMHNRQKLQHQQLFHDMINNIVTLAQTSHSLQRFDPIWIFIRAVAVETDMQSIDRLARMSRPRNWTNQ